MKHDDLFKWSNIALVSIWLGLFAFIPHLFILLNSFLTPQPGAAGGPSLTLIHYYTALLNPLYLKVFWRSFQLASLCTVLCLIIAYPFAYFLTRVKHSYKHLLLSLVLIPFWTSSLIRTYAIITLLKTKGILNTALLSIGIISEPLQLLYTNIAVIIGLVYDLLPFMILPLYTNFEKMDRHYINAARDLGASRTMILTRIMIPLTLPGILSGSLLVFLPAMSLFYIPDVLGGAKSLFLGNLIQQQFLTGSWGLGGALSIMLLGLLMLLLWVGQRLQRQPKNHQNFF
jgi:spermidine/putrescine transport system permease protein